jgi:DUF971 family protein
MQASAPKRISQPSDTELAFAWADGSECVLTLQYLRDECPCANCKGETILGRVYKPVKLQTFSAGMYELVGIEAVGSYAFQIKWKDGHTTGIYSWEYLQLLCEQAARKNEQEKQ